MNSLNILSSRVIGQSSTPNRVRQRSRSQEENRLAGNSPTERGKIRSYSEENFRSLGSAEKSYENTPLLTDGHCPDEKTLLLHELHRDGPLATRSTLQLFAQQLFDAIAETIKFLLSTLTSPGLYAAQCFQEDDGRYSLMAPVRKLRKLVSGPSMDGSSPSGRGGNNRTDRNNNGHVIPPRKLRSHTSRESILSATSESENDRRSVKSLSMSSKPRSTKSKTKSPGSEETSNGNAPRRSIRIKLNNEETLKRQKERQQQQGTDMGQPLHDGVSRVHSTVNPNTLKSPTSPSVHKLDRYPHAPAPPRPLIPLRVPSYTAASRTSKAPQKTLVLDLDETLIHSLAKGGRMSSGHMVEVKLAAPMTTALAPGGPATTLSPQHPILYYVHKRPHCDDFLRKVCKWYKLVVFTASVQEYADPVIDWLEQERKFFHARYYRQHCTFRNGAYIKDLSSVEPDLSKVMILDNSPVSYIFHEGMLLLSPLFTNPSISQHWHPHTILADNAIPIEGWINDPTDNGLLHLIPMLEALQYVTDVRALLALRRGETET
ncbi:hypothetical protein ASPZODRAFT_12712 [Penicilliopsis zonata CBS 506.65]|uniref:FCP1 homology domain-containing protein n=1 Tax=Penicilliopsis zonata CBS 506.65 TaxID=1073090 RepID=A0A1L9SR54_9EURO|nr:hypothetical protein ASPZODRAFT_12712 [Penicilliopsis zonata CBS 506.65]OJJ49584.1 hypothetical protein ASPZODRAFT_12712 [Penicilliopsis zonata CBS 506.65]